ncbi:MAG: cell division protein FtsA [Taibaiella sp.]|nr:cell division protein FtsA [Taibaiella sp.]
MSKKQPIIVGLDIGTTKVAAIAGRKNEFGKLEILAFGRVESAGVSHGVVMNIDQCIRSIEQAIAKCLESNPDLDINEVYVGIAGQHIKSLQTRGDRVRTNSDDVISQADIDLLIRDQYKTYIPAGDQIIDIVPQEFTIDSTPNVLEPIGMNGVKIGANFHIITGDKNAIRNIKRCVDKASLTTRDLVLQPLASAAAVMNDEDMEAGVAIVDIGGGTTDMAVFYDGILKHTAVIPYAGVNITNDIRSGLGVLRAQAEAMKVQYGTALAAEANANAYITIPGLRGLPAKEISVKNLAHIIQARTQEILDYVLFHLKQIGLDKRLYGGIILTGGGAQLKHMIQLTEYTTGLGARIGYPNEHLAGGYAESLMNPMYSTCIGLILRGYHDFENGKMRFVGEGGNYISVENTREEEERYEEEPMEETHDEKTTKRAEKMKKLFDGLKGKFIALFEDVEDEKIE